MKRSYLIKILNDLVLKSQIYAKHPFKCDGDPHDWHEQADKSILEYLDDKEISELFENIEKWYS